MFRVEHSRWRHLVAAVLAAALALQLVFSLIETSVTVDEFAHLPAGIVYWKEGSFAPYHHNPPLLRMIAAAPLLLLEVDTSALGPQDDRWLLGLKFQHANFARYHEFFTVARLPMVGLTVLTSLLIYAWTARSAGYWPAVVAMLLFCFSPTVLAHGGLVTTDAGFSLCFLATMAACTFLIDRVTWPRTLLLGVLVGIAQLTKFTAIIIYPILLIAWIVVPLLARRVKSRRSSTVGLGSLKPLRRWTHLAAVIGISLVVINAGYLFQGTGSPIRSLAFQAPLFKAVSQSPLGIVPSPLPREYVLGFNAQYQESQGVFLAYFLGEHSTQGWLHYYGTALLLKLPLPLFLILAATLVSVWRGNVPRSPLLLISFAIPIFSLVFFSVMTNINLGIRYLLFVLPFLHIAAGHLAIAAAASRRVMIFLILCLVWYMGSSSLQFPYYLSYFSDAVGRSSNGHRLLADSNIDWGQDLVHLRKEMERRGIDAVALAHFGLVDPAVYGIRYEPLSPQPRSPIVAVSVNLLLGIDPWGQGEFVPVVQTMRPIGRVGDSIWLFERP